MRCNHVTKFLAYSIVLMLLALCGCDSSSHEAIHLQNKCISNLRQLHAGKQIWMVEQHKTTNDVPTDSDLFGEGKPLPEKPVCPAGGVYSVGRVAEKVRCSVEGHTYTILQ
jgi:hypothetical protein